MIRMKPQTIQIFLPDGNPRSVKIAELTNRMVKAIYVPRNKLELASKREELKSVGLYFLFGSTPDSTKPIVYIGEAEDCLVRLKEHNKDSEKEFWEYAIVIISKTNVFTKAHIKYLEHISIKLTREVNRFGDTNKKLPKKTYVTESMQADLLDSFETIKVLLTTLGYPLFDSIAIDSIEEKELLYINSVGVEATGEYSEEGIIIFKGSEARVKESSSFSNGVSKLRQTLLTNGVLVKQGEKYIFTENYIAGSPSKASDLIVGNSTNGWDTWKNINGKTLDELKRN